MDQKNQYCKAGYSTKKQFSVNTIPITTPAPFFIDTENTIIIHIEALKTKDRQSNPEIHKAGGIITAEFRLFYRAVVGSIKPYCTNKRTNTEISRLE